MSASKQAAKRLGKEYQAIQKSPPPFVFARPSESNVLEWSFILRGPPETDYFGGEYFGMVIFPPGYPFSPPSIKMMTPSGRFQPNAAICTSMSDFHPGSWNPAWSCSTILTGLLSFMVAEEMTTGSVKSTTAEKKHLASVSHAWNLLHPRFRTMFPEYALPTMVDLPDMGLPPSANPTPPAVPPLHSSGQAIPNSTSTGQLLNSPFVASTTLNGRANGVDAKGFDGGAKKVGLLRKLRTPFYWAFIFCALSWVAIRFFGL